MGFVDRLYPHFRRFKDILGDCSARPGAYLLFVSHMEKMLQKNFILTKCTNPCNKAYVYVA